MNVLFGLHSNWSINGVNIRDLLICSIFNNIVIMFFYKGCRYEHSDWSECDQATNTVTRNFTLSEGEQGCEQSHTITIACDKLNRIQAWKAKKRDRKQKKIDEKLQMKQDRKEKRKLEKEQRLSMYKF